MRKKLMRFSAVLLFASGFILLFAIQINAASPLGAQYSEDGTSIQFGVYSSRATRVELFVFDKSQDEDEKARLPLAKDGATSQWSITVPIAALRAKGVSDVVYYGYRCWGPNWPFDTAWNKGSSSGFISDVDGAGNRFNPNKLLIDPYAREVSHDPTHPGQPDGGIYNSGVAQRNVDTGTKAPKGLVLPREVTANNDTTNKPRRAFKDEIIYEVQLRGLTKADVSVDTAKQGTYAGAAMKAPYLKSLGVTAVEFLPLQEADNDSNDLAKDHANYWGYDPYNYFSPDRRYAFNKAPGGPTQEFKSMVRAFHNAGIKVYVDMVYNHTGEGGTSSPDGATARLLSWRGFDSPAYYELAQNHAYFEQTNAVPEANVNTVSEVKRQEIIDALRYWKDVLGVDGYRFDLAGILGNSMTEGGFHFDKMDPKNVLNRAYAELPIRPEAGGEGIDLIAEPWGLDNLQGQFPHGWAEWNDYYRDAVRRSQNKLGFSAVPLAELARRIGGSSDHFQNNGRKPWHSVNFLDCHDGFTLRDLYAYNSKQNSMLKFPAGPSDGGSDDNSSWDQNGVPENQRQAARTGLALLMLSAGVPMISGGDELYRTQLGNNNPYNLDTDAEYLHFPTPPDVPHFVNFTHKLFAFRNAHPALRPAEYFAGNIKPSGLKDIAWLRDDGHEAGGDYLDNTANHFLAYRLDAAGSPAGVSSIYVAFNGWSGDVSAQLPPNLAGKKWYRVCDTASWMESQDNFNDVGNEDALGNLSYTVHGRTLLLLVEK